MIKFHTNEKKITEINNRTFVQKINEKFKIIIDIENDWNHISQLRWYMKSDLIISEEDVAERIREIQGYSNYRIVCRSMSNLMRYISQKYVVFKNEPINVLIQIIALGENVTECAGNSFQFLQYVKTEIQDIQMTNFIIV